MREVKDTMRVVGVVVLGLFVLVVVVIPLLGLTFNVFSFVFGLAVGLIKLAVVVAIGYLALVGIRALLR